MHRSTPAESTIPPGVLERVIEVLHPEEVWLFGSRARGDHRPDSDWDLLVVVPDGAADELVDIVSVWERLRDLRLRRVEVFPVRRSEFDDGKRARGTLSQIASTEGRVVYGR